MELTKNNCVYDDYEGMYDDTLYQETENDIILLADLGYWNGRNYAVVNVSEEEETKSVYELATKHLLSRCESHLSVYSDGTDVITVEAHHDNTNYYYYRQMTNKAYKKFLKFVESCSYSELNDRKYVINRFLQLSKPVLGC